MYEDSLYHHGILGQKWGVRRFENAAGRLTAAGKSRYNQINGEYQKLKKKVMPSKVESTGEKKKEGTDNGEEKKKGLTDKQKKMIIAGAAIAGTALAAYGGYKLYQKGVQTRAHAHMLATGTSAVNKAIAKESNTKLSALKDYQSLQSNPNKPTFSKPAQNAAPKIDRSTVEHTPIDRIQIDRATVDRIKVDRTPINIDSFNKAAQANDDFVNSLLKKNAKNLGL